MKVTSPGDLTREAIPDAPSGQWIDTMLSNRNEFIRKAIAAFRNNITVLDNTPYVEKEIDLKHGVEMRVSNPLSGISVKSVAALQCDGLTLDDKGQPTGQVYTLDKPAISWRPTGDKDGSIFVKAMYELNHTYPCLIHRATADQNITDGTKTALVYDYPYYVRGDVITTADNTIFTIGEPGTYFVTITCNMKEYYYRELELSLDTADVQYLIYSNTIDEDASGARIADGMTPTIVVGMPMSFNAGDTVQAFIRQRNATAATHEALGAHIVYRKIAIHRLYNDTIPVGRVNLLFYGA